MERAANKRKVVRSSALRIDNIVVTKLASGLQQIMFLFTLVEENFFFSKAPNRLWGLISFCSVGTIDGKSDRVLNPTTYVRHC
jgi:hypothetical protein